VAVFEAFWSCMFMLGLWCVSRQLFGTIAAIVSVTLFALSPDMIYWLPRHLDVVWPAFLLWAFYLFFRDGDKTWSVILSAACVTIALWVKELALLFILFIFLIQIFPSTRTPLRKLILFLSGFIIFTAVMMALNTFSGTSTLKPAIEGGEGYQELLLNIMGTFDIRGFLNLVWYGIEGLWFYFVPGEDTRSILPTVPLLPLMLISLGWIGYQAFKGDKHSLLTALAIASFLPAAALAGQLGLRPSQLLFLIAFLYLALANAGVHFIQWLLARYDKEFLLRRAVGLLLVVLLVLQGFLGRFSYADVMKDSNILARVFSGDPVFTYRMRGAELSRWLEHNLEKGENAMIGHVPYQHGAAWLAKPFRDFYFLPLHQTSPKMNWPYYPEADANQYDYDLAGIYRSHAKRQSPVVFFLSEQALTEQIKQNNIRYIVLSRLGTDHMVMAYAEHLPYLEKVAEIEDYSAAMHVFEVSPKDITKTGDRNPPPYLNEPFIDYMNRIKGEEDGRYQWYREKALINIMQMNNAQIQSALDKKGL